MSIDNFDQAQGSLRTWLWGITRNKLRHYVRSQVANPGGVGGTEAHVAIEQIPEQPFEESTGQGNPEWALMHRAIGQVRPEFQDPTWQAFWRTVVEGERTADVAQELGMTTQAVRQARYRVLRRLRDELEGEVTS